MKLICRDPEGKVERYTLENADSLSAAFAHAKEQLPKHNPILILVQGGKKDTQ